MFAWQRLAGQIRQGVPQGLFYAGLVAFNDGRRNTKDTRKYNTDVYFETNIFVWSGYFVYCFLYHL